MTKSGKHCGKRRNCTFCAISSFVTMFFKKPSAAEASESVYMRERANLELYYFVQWPYREFVGIIPSVKAPANNEFTITIVKGPKKTDTMKFSTDHRADLLTEALVSGSITIGY